MQESIDLCAKAVLQIDNFLIAKQKSGSYDRWLARYEKTPDQHDDNFLFGMLVQAMFSGGMSGKVVDKWMPRMEGAFNNWDVIWISKLSTSDLNSLASSGNVINNRPKLNAIVKNAKHVKSILSKYETFGQYLSSFENFQDLSVDLTKRFSFLGPITTEDFLRNVGFDTAKPDRHLTRWLTRMRVVDGYTPTKMVMDTVKSIATITKLPQSRIDAAIYLFCADRDDVIDGGVCSIKPNCISCPISNICPQDIIDHKVVKNIRPTRQKLSTKKPTETKYTCKPNSVWATCYPGKPIEEIKTINPFAVPSWLRQPYGENGSRDRFSDICKLFAGGRKVDEAKISEVNSNDGKYVAFRAIVHKYAVWKGGLLVRCDE